MATRMTEYRRIALVPKNLWWPSRNGNKLRLQEILPVSDSSYYVQLPLLFDSDLQMHHAWSQTQNTLLQRASYPARRYLKNTLSVIMSLKHPSQYPKAIHFLFSFGFSYWNISCFQTGSHLGAQVQSEIPAFLKFGQAGLHFHSEKLSLQSDSVTAWWEGVRIFFTLALRQHTNRHSTNYPVF